MSEIVLELSLVRSSGVLAGVVASLAQAGIELKSQKVDRSEGGRGGWLTITGEGDPPEPSVLSERLNGTRGVDRLMRVVVDGEAVLADGEPIVEALDNTLGPEDLAELSAGGAPEAEAVPNDADAPDSAEPETIDEPAPAQEKEPESTQIPASENTPEDDLAVALTEDSGDSATEPPVDDDEAPDATPQTAAERERAALRRWRRRRR